MIKSSVFGKKKRKWWQKNIMTFVDMWRFREERISERKVCRVESTPWWSSVREVRFGDHQCVIMNIYRSWPKKAYCEYHMAWIFLSIKCADWDTKILSMYFTILSKRKKTKVVKSFWNILVVLYLLHWGCHGLSEPPTRRILYDHNRFLDSWAE